MGCWNATCGLTHLPIHDNDPVVACIIQEQDSRDYTPSYPWSRWSPASMLVRGTYDDYGDVELDATAVSLLKQTQDDAARAMRRIRVRPKADDQSDEVDEEENFTYGMVSIETFIAEELPDEGHRSRSRQNQRPNSGFALWMAHAPVYDRLCRELKPDDWRTSAKSPRDLAEKRAAEVVKEDMRLLTAEPMSRFRMDDGWSLRGEGVYSAAIRGIAAIQDELVRAPAFDQQTYDFIKDRWIDLHCLNTIMDELRITLSPLGGAGSQGGDMRNYSVLTRTINEQIRARKAYLDG